MSIGYLLNDRAQSPTIAKIILLFLLSRHTLHRREFHRQEFHRQEFHRQKLLRQVFSSYENNVQHQPPR
ncbi:hypothetical protein G9P44_000816 [Scheffersomyces stipitis]|nr:hypothetical protein G9P44_000816 [Scheffersomyces stipitis]